MNRCTFCAQIIQTGASFVSKTQAPDRINTILSAMNIPERCEVAFYGGTFTHLPQKTQRACIEAVRQRQKNISMRCSTRPDALDHEWLCSLKQYGMATVELGIQSYDTQALALTLRGYDGETAQAGCKMVRECGLRLGVQLMPGMPGVTPEIFLRDVATAIRCGADLMRFYPCLVFEGTELAAAWERGDYVPWTVDMTVAALGAGLAMAWKAGVPVIRIGVAPEHGLDRMLLAGPWHAALGSLVQAEALARTVEAFVRNAQAPVVGVRLPRRAMGFTGKTNSTPWERWKAVGIDPEMVTWWDEDYGLVEYGAERLAAS